MFQGDSELTAYSEVGLGLGTPTSEDFGITLTLHETKNMQRNRLRGDGLFRGGRGSHLGIDFATRLIDLNHSGSFTIWGLIIFG
jgi:hypothetical protein